MKSLLAALLMLSSCLVSAQTKLDRVNSKELLDKGVQYYLDGKYDDAIDTYDKIPENDSLYLTAMNEKVVSLISLERYDDAIYTARTVLDMSDDKLPEFYTNLGTALDDAGRGEEALEVYDEGLAQYPKSHQMQFNKAVTYFKLEQFDKCLKLLQQNLELNPVHAGTHYLLGLLAAQEGYYTQAVLSLNTFLILEPVSDRSITALTILESVANGTYDKSGKKGVKLSNGEDFSEIDALLESKVALNKKYKVHTDLGYDFLRQEQLIMEKLKVSPNSNGFWTKYYVPFYVQLFKEGHFEDFSYLICASIDDEATQKILKKNLSGIKSFADWGGSTWLSSHEYKNYTLNGVSKEYRFMYSDGYLSLIADIQNISKSEQGIVGYFEAYGPNGCLSTTGTFDRSGQKNGLFTYYDDLGRLNGPANYTAGKTNGDYTEYYPNGNVQSVTTFKNDVRTGPAKTYYYYGGLKEDFANLKDVKDGPYKMYYANGALHYDATYKNDELEGELKEYYATGEIMEVSHYKAGLPEGQATQYYRNGQILFDANYVNGMLDGARTTYYSNGNFEEKSNYKAGTQIGEATNYYRNGAMSSHATLDESGKLNGTSEDYDDDGVRYFSGVYAKGVMQSYAYYAKDGSILSEGKQKGTKLTLVGYSPDGTKRMEGDYEKGDRSGVWKFYDNYGNLESTEPYTKNQINGLLTSDHKSGAVESKINYVDGAEDGYAVWYHKNGNIESQGYYEMGNEAGHWYQYNTDGTMAADQYFVEGLRHGRQHYYNELGKPDDDYIYQYGALVKVFKSDTSGTLTDTVVVDTEEFEWKEYHYNKALRYDAQYKNGITNGFTYWYGPGNALETKGTNNNGKREGQWIWYYPNGTVSTERNYETGDLSGVSNDYFESGKLRYTRNFVLDKLQGETQRYYENGKLEEKGTFEDDEKDGTFYLYDMLGELQIVKYYDRGKFVGYSYNDASGKLVPMVPLNNGTGKIVSYYKNGKKSYEYGYTNGEIDGPFAEYQSNGKLIQKATYVKGDAQGEYLSYYSNGNVHEKEYYKDDELNGECTYYYENGKVKRITHYVMNNEFGTEILYDSNGKQIKTIEYYNGFIVNEK